MFNTYIEYELNKELNFKKICKIVAHLDEYKINDYGFVDSKTMFVEMQNSGRIVFINNKKISFRNFDTTNALKLYEEIIKLLK